MATIFSHPAVAIGLIPLFKSIIKKKLVIVFAIFLTILPDFDIIGYYLKIPYNSLFGHRGFSHSIIFACLMSFLFAIFIKYLYKFKLWKVWLYFFLSIMSHSFLDSITNGGLGVAFFSPFSNKRYFMPFRLLLVSPIGLKRFFTHYGWTVIISELKCVWFPSLILFLIGIFKNIIFKNKI